MKVINNFRSTLLYIFKFIESGLLNSLGITITFGLQEGTEVALCKYITDSIILSYTIEN